MTAPGGVIRLARRWAVWGVVVLAVVAALVVGAHRTGSPSTLQQRTTSVASEVRCPVCGGENAAQSQVPAAVDIRNQIHQELAAGVPTGRILDDLVSAYGPSILERPPATGIGLVVWVLPIVAVMVAAIGLVLAFARWRRPRLGHLAGSDGAGPGGPGGLPGARAEDEALVARAMAVAPSPAGPPAARPPEAAS